MKFAYAAVALVCSVAAAVDYKTVVADIATIRKDLVALNTTCTKFQPGLDLGDALTLLSQSSTLNNAIKQATSDANASPPFGKKGSNVIAARVISLEKPIFSTLDNFVASKPKFDKAILGVIGLSFIVLNQLQTLKNSTDALGAAIVPKLSASLQGVAPSIIGQIDEHFQEAITAYGG